MKSRETTESEKGKADLGVIKDEMDTSFEILQPEQEKPTEKSSIVSAKPDLIPTRKAEERRNATSQPGTKLHLTEGANRGKSSGSRILSDAISFVGSNQSGSVVRNKVSLSDSPGKSAKAKQPISGNVVPNVAEASQGTPKSQYPSSMAAKEKSGKSNPDETKYPKDKHVHWQSEDVKKGEKVTVLTPGQTSVQVNVDSTKSAPLADVEEVDSMWFTRDDRQKKRITSLDDDDVNLAQSIKSSFGKNTRVTSQCSTSVVTQSKKYSHTVTKITPTSGQFKEPDITSYSVQRSEKHGFVSTGSIGDHDNKENVTKSPSEKSQNLAKIDVATKDVTNQRKDKEEFGGSLFGITGEKRMTDDGDDDKMKDKPRAKSDAEKKKIVLPVIRPTDPRRWAIAVTDYSHTPQTNQPVSTRSMAPVGAQAKRDPQVEERPKDRRRWGVAPRGQGMAPLHEQLSQEFECKKSDAKCTEPPPDSRRQNVQLSATVATTKPHQSPLLSTSTSTKQILPKLMQPARKTSPGIVYYDDRASALSMESLEDESSSEHQLYSTRKTEDTALQGAVGVSRFRRADTADNALSDKDIKDDDTDPGPPYILYRRVQDGGQPSSVVVTPPQDMAERETIRSYSRRDPDAESILSEDIPMYVRKDQRQDMLASRIGSQSYPLLSSSIPPHHTSQDSVSSMTEVRADHGKKGFMVYMVTKQPSPGPSEEAADDDTDVQARYQPSDKADDTANDIEYYGPRRIHTKPTSHQSGRNHYHSMPDMERFGELQKTGSRPLSTRSASGEDDQQSSNITYKPAYGPYSEMIENTGHTFGIFGQKLAPEQHQTVPKSPKSPRSPRIQRPKGPPPPVPPRKTPVKTQDEGAEIKPKTLQEIAAGEGHMFGIFGQQVPRDSGDAQSHTSFGSLSSSSVKDIMSKLDLFEERGRRMDKTGAVPAVLGQERVEVSLLRQNIVTQAGEPFGERQFVIGKASPMGARLTRPIGGQGEQLIVSPQNQDPREDPQRQVHDLEGRPQQPREQEDVQEEEKVFSVLEIIQKLNTGQPPEVSTKKDATKYERCPYTAVAKRYIADSEKPTKPMRYDDKRELEDMVPYSDPPGFPQVEKISEFRELQMIYQNTSSIQEYDEEPLRKQQIEETLIDDDIKFMDDTDVTSIDSDTDSGSDHDDDGNFDMNTSLTPQESLRRLKPLGEKRVAQIHAIIDRKLGPKKSGGRDSPMEDISTYCLSKEKQHLLSKTQKIPSTLQSRYGPPRRVQTTELATPSERKISGGKRSEPAYTQKNDDDDDLTPVDSEGSSDNESVDTQRDVPELPFDEVTEFVDNGHIEDIAQVEKQDSELEVKETVPGEAKANAEYYDMEDEMSKQAEEDDMEDEMSKQAEEEDRLQVQKENEEREKEELLRNEQKILELEEKLAKLEGPVRDAVKKLLQVSSNVNKVKSKYFQLK